MRRRLFARAVALAAVALILASQAVWADTLVADGDALAPVTNNDLGFGTVCAGSTTTKPVLLVVNRNGAAGSTNVFKNGSNVAVSVLSVTGTGLTTLGGGTIAIPAGWSGLPNNTDSSTVSATVQLVAGGPGLFSGSVSFRASGINSSNGAIFRDDPMAVSATVVGCDTTPPVLSLPAAITTEATSAAGAGVTYAATASDANPANPSVTCLPASGSTFPLGTTTVLCSATDAASNTANGSFSVTVQDTTPPTISGTPSGLTAEATGPSGATVTYTDPTASDLVDGTVTVSCLPASGATFALGGSLVTCTATDAHSNTATSDFNVTVADTTAPILVVPADLTAEATGPTGASVTFTASATDLVDGVIVPVCVPGSGSTFALGTTTVACTATDAASNATSDTFDVTVEDTTAPVVTVPANITAEATGPSGALVSYSASASDLVDGALTPVCVPASGSTFALGTTLVNCTATDAAGNTGSASFNVVVVDTTPPVITTPSNITAGPTSVSGASVAYASASALDTVSGDLPTTCSPASGSAFGFGSTTVTCSATDAAGNTGHGTFTVTISGFTFLGFFQPVDMNTVNTVKNGSTVPVKWKLEGAGGIEITSTSAVAVGWPRYQKLDCGTLSSLPEDLIETTATGGTSLRYDTTAAQYVYNWQTPKQPNTCWRLDVRFVDGSTRTATFKLK